MESARQGNRPPLEPATGRHSISMMTAPAFEADDQENGGGSKNPDSSLKDDYQQQIRFVDKGALLEPAISGCTILSMTAPAFEVGNREQGRHSGKDVSAEKVEDGESTIMETSLTFKGKVENRICPLKENAEGTEIHQ